MQSLWCPCGHYEVTLAIFKLIHEADPQSRPEGKWSPFSHVVSVRPSVQPSVLPHVSKSHKTNKFQVKIAITAGGTVGLAEWIINGTHALYYFIIVQLTLNHFFIH